MNARVEKGEIERLAHAARLAFSSEDIERMQRQLTEVLEYVSLLQRWERVGEACTELAISLPQRLDNVRAWPSELIMDCAPLRDGGYFVVPGVLSLQTL